jgi:hypothetical protein
MKSFVCAFALFALASAGTLMAQQDSTVQWKTSLQDLEQRLASLPSEGAPVEAWRTDAEALRSSLASFADSSPALKIQVPDALPTSPDHQALTKQLDALNAAVNR